MALTVRPLVGVVPAPRQAPEQAELAVEGLLDGLESLPGHRSVLLRVASLSDDEDTSLTTLAEACAADPPFAARLLGLANSAYYARRSPATSLEVAISTMGREALRSLALVTALGLSGDTSTVPDGFWSRAAQVASASSLVARAVGARPGDAFCAGLLADVGQALLLRSAPLAYAEYLDMPCDATRREAEASWCGIGHAQVGARVLSRTGLPEPLCAAVAQHDAGADGPAQDPLTRAVQIGVLLARAVDAGSLDDEGEAVLLRLSEGALTGLDGTRVILQSAAAAAALSAALA